MNTAVQPIGVVSVDDYSIYGETEFKQGSSSESDFNHEERSEAILDYGGLSVGIHVHNSIRKTIFNKPFLNCSHPTPPPESLRSKRLFHI
ncbi:MAG: hypothetical protein WCY25_09965 [Moheibacter sp.]